MPDDLIGGTKFFQNGKPGLGRFASCVATATRKTPSSRRRGILKKFLLCAPAIEVTRELFSEFRYLPAAANNHA
jgi:hypothetical protein